MRGLILSLHFLFKARKPVQKAVPVVHDGGGANIVQVAGTAMTVCCETGNVREDRDSLPIIMLLSTSPHFFIFPTLGLLFQDFRPRREPHGILLDF